MKKCYCKENLSIRKLSLVSKTNDKPNLAISVAKAGRLRQVVFKSAFDGRLV